MNKAILLISSKDQRGITAGVTNFIFEHNGNILHADQHIDEQSNTFFMRVEWSLDGFQLNGNEIKQEFTPIAEKFQMQWSLYFADQVPKVAIFASKHLHCLYDLLYRSRSGQLPCTISLVISNHPDAKPIADEFKVAFHEIAITEESKGDQEARELKLLEGNSIDLIILARYHQVLTKDFVARYENRIINIHHSFLPAFAGKDPYGQAYQKGVKIIGATSHYVTEALDQGPIIDQDTARVSHRHTLNDLKQIGEDLERVVLNRAVRLHLDRKILCYNNKTVIFD